MSADDFYHEPVLLGEVLDLLITNRSGIYLDCTLGGGGHFRAIANQLNNDATVIGIDRDPDALAYNREHGLGINKRLILEQSRFSLFDEVLSKYGIRAVDGILLDLGVSSFQIDKDTRGFSYMRESDLDMRMNPDEGISASELIKTVSEDELAQILAEYGEIQNAVRMAVVMKKCSLKTSADLRNCLNREYGKNLQIKIISRVFQALRIAVNDELGELRRFLSKVTKFLVATGRLAIISYHSLEDRMVKHFLREQEKKCICPLDVPYCTCGKRVLLNRVTKKALKAGENEIRQNVRARSARLRVAERTGEGIL